MRSDLQKAATEAGDGKSSASWEAAFAALPGGACVFDGALSLIVANGKVAELFRLPESALHPGLPLSRACELLRGASAASEDAGEFRNRSPVDIRYPQHDGRMILGRYRPTGDGGWVASFDDITAAERLERERQSHSGRFEQAIRAISQGFAIYGEDERLIVANEQYARIYGVDFAVLQPGITMREVIEHFIGARIYPDVTAEQLYISLMGYLKSEKPADYVRQLADGRYLHIHMRLLIEGGWIFICEDITSREEAAAELREQHRRFDAALNNMSQGLCMFDSANRLTVCNERYVTLFKADPDVVKPGVTLREIFAHGVSRGVYQGVTADELVERRLSSLTAGGLRRYDQPMADGRTIEVSLSVMADGGWLGVVEDVTERRRLEADRAEAISALQQKNMLLDATLQSMGQGLCVFDSELRIVTHNQRYLEIYDVKSEIVRPGVTLLDAIRHSVKQGMHHVDAEAVFAEFRDWLFAGKEPVLHRRLADGRIIAVKGGPMENGGWVATFEDITEIERNAKELSEQHRRFNAALNNIPHGLVMLDDELRLIVCNQTYLDMYGVSADVVKPGAPMVEIMRHSISLGNYSGVTAEEMVADLRAQLQASSFAMDRRLSSGRVIKVVYRPMPHGGWVAVHEDVTELRKAEAHLAHLAHHDALTGLPNRTLLRERLDAELQRVRDEGGCAAVISLDLDRFKQVNDTLGHDIGDRLLVGVAQRLREASPAGATVARLGGDEFVLLAAGADRDAAVLLADRLVALIDAPFAIEGRSIRSGVSAGVALAPDHSLNADELLKRADLALYLAKSQGRSGFRLSEYSPTNAASSLRGLAADMRQPSGADALGRDPEPRRDLIRRQGR